MARNRRRKLVAVVGVVVALGCLGVYGYTVLAKPATSIDPSRLASVERGDLARSVVATGKVEPITKVEIKSKANGIIKELKVEVGDPVVEGQVLAELDHDNLAARLREARAALAGAQANLKGAEAELAKNQVEAEGPARRVRAAEPRPRREAGVREADFGADARRRAQRARGGREPPVGRALAARRQRGAGGAGARQRRPGPGRGGARRRGARPTPPSGRPSTASSSRATSRSAARCRRSSTSARTPRS